MPAMFSGMMYAVVTPYADVETLCAVGTQSRASFSYASAPSKKIGTIGTAIPMIQFQAIKT